MGFLADFHDHGLYVAVISAETQFVFPSFGVKGKPTVLPCNARTQAFLAFAGL